MTSQNSSRIKRCRICGNKKLVKIGSLGDIAISDFTNTPQEGRKYPLELVYCEKCTLLQLAHNTPRKELYKNYWYESHINPVIVNDLKEIASYTKPNSIHIDIGANDGTLLKYSKAQYKYAVDPSDKYPGEGVAWVKDYWENVTVPTADTITAIACLYDLPDPNKFMANISRHLLENGVFIAQLMTLQPMIENNDVGNICHEHLEYYSYSSLVRLYEANGLEIFKVEENDINGGSYRIFARNFQKGSVPYKEKTYGAQNIRDFFRRIETTKRAFLQEMGEPMSRYKVCGYGASTKANTVLQYYGITNYMLSGIVDVNPDKVGKYTIASGIPIIDTIPSDTEYLWVFPYGFIDYFKKKERGYKGRWLTTIPTLKVC